MDAPDELRQAVALAVKVADAALGDNGTAPALTELGASKIADAVLAVPAIADALRDAARRRSLAATFDNRLNREQTFTGAQVAAMLRDDS